MGVYDMIRANVECPNCNEQLEWMEQLKLGFYRMDSFYIGDKIKGCDLSFKWEITWSCENCKEPFNFIYYIDNGWFNSVIVFDKNWKRFKKYTKDNKLKCKY